MVMNNYIRFDWAMKSRFCESNYWNVLEGFLSVLLKHQVHIQRLIRRKTIQQEESSLVNRIDILAIEDSRDPVLVRIQTFRELAYFHVCDTVHRV
jgi:hypothetical protein